MYTIFVSVVATLVANMLLELFKFWLENHKQVLKKRNKRH
ncbi:MULTISPECIES: type I toxin-antitoxin system Fst family toxin [Lactococcus]|nr:MULTISPECIES: type I toxin-antitoxin system Fst family toxin [Lactococcus]